MCNPGLTKHIQENPNGLFLSKSEEYLGLHHGDTESSHPYVRSSLTAAQNTAAQIAVKSAPLPSVAREPARNVVAPLSWHGQYCLNRYGRTTPGV